MELYRCVYNKVYQKYISLVLAVSAVAIVLSLSCNTHFQNCVYNWTDGKFGAAITEGTISIPITDNGKYELSFNDNEIELTPVTE